MTGRLTVQPDDLCAGAELLITQGDVFGRKTQDIILPVSRLEKAESTVAEPDPVSSKEGELIGAVAGAWRRDAGMPCKDQCGWRREAGHACRALNGTRVIRCWSRAKAKSGFPIVIL